MLGATLVEMLPVAHQDALFWCCINVFCILICVTAAIFPFKFQMFVFWEGSFLTRHITRRKRGADTHRLNSACEKTADVCGRPRSSVGKVDSGLTSACAGVTGSGSR